MQHFIRTMLTLLAIITITTATSRSHLEPDGSDADFIRASCQATTYPDLCYKTLSPYATIIKTNPKELVNAALTVSLKSAKSTSKVVRELSKGRDLSMRDGQAVADCMENMSDSVDELKKSMVALKDSDGPEVKEKMGNVKTWVSAALTDEDTCMDGFEENVGKMKETIRGYIVNVAELTSIALALITNVSSA